MFKIRIVSNLEEARKIWNELCSCDNLYEDWNFRFVFYERYNPEYDLSCRFYVGEEDGKLVGALPLQHNRRNGYLEFFGGSFMEDNHVFVKPGYEKYIPEFYGAVNEKAKLQDIVIDDRFVPLVFLENKYVIDLRGMGSLDDYLDKTFRKRRVRRFKDIMEEIDASHPVIFENRPEDLEIMMDLNAKNFKDSFFNEEFRRNIYRDLLGKGKFHVVMMSVEICGKVESVCFGIKYKNIFVSLNSGTNKEAARNLGSFMTLKRIEKAISLGCETFDAGLESLGWKELWHLKKIPEHKFYYGA